MVRTSLLHTRIARAVARKSGVRTTGSDEEGGAVAFLARLAYSFFGPAYYLINTRRLSPYTDPDNISQSGEFGVIDATLGGRLVVPEGGLYRLYSTSNLVWALDAWPMVVRMEAVVRTEANDFVSATLMHEIYFSSEPQTSYTPPGSFERRAWEFTSEFYLHGEAFVEAEVGQTISTEITWEFSSAGTSGPGGDLSTVMSSSDGLSLYRQFIELVS